MSPLLIPIVCISLVLLTHRRWRTYLFYRASLPPGPLALPIIGNLLTKPTQHEWRTYASWVEKYGDVMYMDVLGTPIVVVNSRKAATELLEKRSANYSDRPRLIMADELMGWSWDFAHMGYSERWRRHRKTFHQYFQARAISSFRPVLHEAATALLERLVASPDNYTAHLRQYAGSIILRLTYGYDVRSENDDYIALIGRAMAPLMLAIHAGSYWVDYLPFLKDIPDWFPGADFKRKGKEATKHSLTLINRPFDGVKQALPEGTITPSFVSENLEQLYSVSPSNSDAELKHPKEAMELEQAGEESQEDVIKNCAGVAYAAGSDTTFSTITTFIALMALHPSIQARAQAEIDSVIGNAAVTENQGASENAGTRPDLKAKQWRLPTFDDRASMPYLEALLAELLRWHPAAPLALPHQTINDDVYEGYLIPAGATVIANAWAILRDPTVYTDPLTFNPDRFLPDPECKDNNDNQLQDVANISTFGFGRRICPGRHLAVESLWIAIVSILAAFNIESGEESKTLEFTSGVVSHPRPFGARLVPRSSAVVGAVQCAREEGAVTA